MNTLIAMALTAILGTMSNSAADISQQVETEIVEVTDDKKMETPENTDTNDENEETVSKESSISESEIIEETDVEESENPESIEEPVPDILIYSADDLAYAGVIYGDGVTYTWYSETELSGEGLDIPGRHHELGFIMDGDGNICVASCDYPRGTPISVPFGYGRAIVYDYCPTSGIVDVYMP